MAVNRTGFQTYVICDSSSHPSNPYNGLVIYEQDTKRIYIYDGVEWNAVVFGNEVTLQSACTGASIISGPQDYDYTTSSSSNTRFQLTHTKLRADSNIIVEIYGTCWSSATGGLASIFVSIDNTTDYQTGKLYYNETSSHKLIAGVTSISSVSAGSHTYKLRWNRAAGTFVTDTGDYGFISVRESL